MCPNDKRNGSKKHLQLDDINLSRVLTLFDIVVSHFPATKFRLDENASTVECLHVESVPVKVQDRRAGDV